MKIDEHNKELYRQLARAIGLNNASDFFYMLAKDDEDFLMDVFDEERQEEDEDGDAVPVEKAAANAIARLLLHMQFELKEQSR